MPHSEHDKESHQFFKPNQGNKGRTNITGVWTTQRSTKTSSKIVSKMRKYIVHREHT